MVNERNEKIDSDKLNQLIKEKGIKEKELTKDEIKKISKNFTVKDLFPIISELNKGKTFDGVTGNKEITNLKMNVLYLIDQCNENEKEALNEKNQNKIKEQEQELNEIKKKQEQEKKENDEKVDTLKQLLFGDDKEAKDKVDTDNVLKATLQVVALNNQNHQTLEDIKKLQEDLKKATDDKNLEEVAKINEELEKKKLELKGLLGQKDDLYYQYFGEKYDDDNGTGIQEFKRRGKFIGKREIGDKKVYGVMNPLAHKRVARIRLNRVIRQMNEIGNDSTTGMKMVMNRCHLNGARPISRGMKSIANTFRLKDPAKFSAKYDEQANEFIRDLSQKIETAGGLSDDDKKTIALIEKRLKWYKEDYKKKFLNM